MLAEALGSLSNRTSMKNDTRPVNIVIPHFTCESNKNEMQFWELENTNLSDSQHTVQVNKT